MRFLEGSLESNKSYFSVDENLLTLGDEVYFNNFTKDAKSLVCHVYEDEDEEGVLIYIPSVNTSHVFKKLETA